MCISRKVNMTNFKKMKTREWPWERKSNPASINSEYGRNYALNYADEQPMFSSLSYNNCYFDNSTTRAAMKASTSVVTIVTYSDDEEIFKGTGTIIEDDGTILTSVKLIASPTSENVVAENLKVLVYMWDGKSCEAKVLVHDFIFGIVVVQIQHDGPLPKACLRPIDDCISIDLSEPPTHDPHSKTYNLVPGDKVIALGRYFIKPYYLMVAPGEFSIGRCDNYFDCKEQLESTCYITENGIGGPVINLYGEVIGMASCGGSFAPFVPINIALKWWEHYKDSGKLPRRPLLGMEMANFYTADIEVMEKLILKFPNYFAGVIVEEVIQGSSADIAGIHSYDIIVECCGKTVRCFLELFDMMWDKIGHSVDLAVLRASEDVLLHFSVKVVEATQSKKPKVYEDGNQVLSNRSCLTKDLENLSIV